MSKSSTHTVPVHMLDERQVQHSVIVALAENLKNSVLFFVYPLKHKYLRLASI